MKNQTLYQELKTAIAANSCIITRDIHEVPSSGYVHYEPGRLHVFLNGRELTPEEVERFKFLIQGYEKSK